VSPVQRPAATDPVDVQRHARPPESATFAGRVGNGRGRPPLLALGFVVLLAGMVAVGVGGHAPGPSPLASSAAAGGSTPPVAATFQHSSPEREPVPLAASPSPPMAPVVTSLGGPIEIRARRHPETMYVHGDVYVERVTWVFVSLQDRSGRVAGWASVSVPGAAGPGVGEGPTLRFDVELAVPSEAFEGPLWIRVNAYDVTGKLIGTTKVGVNADGSPINGPSGFGARPGVFFPLLDASWEDAR